LLKQAAINGGFASAHLAGQKDKTTATTNPV